ncbi:MAG: DUF493 domain-containing protein [Desulfosarcina sp.]|nr:DUF493 domain-containing protein [Desulfobacterales bacterium]
MDKPAVTYPCQWSLTLIGTEEKAVRASVAACLDGSAYRLTPSQKSRSRKYVSLHLDTEVASADEHNRLFARLKKTPAIKMIL